MTKAADPKQFVDDVVTALTGKSGGAADATGLLKSSMRHATEELSLQSAEAFARALLEARCQEPVDPRRLEALLILGLAHPTILERNHISLQQEADRLAKLLTDQGQPERAQALLEVVAAARPGRAQRPAGAEADRDAAQDEAEANGELGADGPDGAPAEDGKPARKRKSGVAETHKDARHMRIETLVAHADLAAGRGDAQEAIRLLQEVLTLDRDRRDVVRMIRELHWKDERRRASSIRVAKSIGLAVLSVALVVTILLREMRIHSRFLGIPPAESQNAESLHARLSAIENLFDRERVWFGMADVLRDRSNLRRELAEIEERESHTVREAAMERERQLAMADSTRSRGMLLVREGRFDEALTDLRRSLELGGPNWRHRREVEINVRAIADWIAKTSREDTQR